MAYIKVDIKRLGQLGSQLDRIPSVINSTASAVRAVRSGLDWDVACEANIDNTLRRIASDLEACKSRMQNTARFVDSAVQQYNNVEYGGKGIKKGNVNFEDDRGGSIITGESFTIETSPEELASKRQKYARTILSKIGPVGKVLSAIKFEFVNSDDTKSIKIAKCAKGVLSCTGAISAYQKISENAELLSRFKNPSSHPIFGGQHNEYKITNLLGLNKFDFRKALGDNALLGKSGLGWDSFKYNVGVGFKQNLKSTFIKPDGSINGFGIAGVVLDFGIKGRENWEDYRNGKISSSDRVLVETVSETAFDLALTAGATTLISAGLVAVGAVSAPALAVGIAAGVVVTGVNELTKSLTGSTLTQHAGNLVGNIYDTGKEAAVNIVKDFGKAVKKGSKVIESVKEKMNSLGNELAEKTKALFTTSILKPAWL